MKTLQVTINKPMETWLCADQREWHADAQGTIWISAETIWNSNSIKHVGRSWILAQRFWTNMLDNPDGWAEGAGIQVHNAQTNNSMTYTFSHVSYAGKPGQSGGMSQVLVYEGVVPWSQHTLLVFRDGATMRNYWAERGTPIADDLYTNSIAMAVGMVKQSFT